MKNLLIQAGLYKTTEFQYVAFPYWQEIMYEMGREHHLPPELITVDPWHYLGLDISKDSIDYLNDKKVENPLIEYKHLGLGAICQENTNYHIHDIYGTKKGSLVDLDTLFEQNSDKNIRAVVMDIEMEEVNLFDTYTFKVKPDFFGVEAHSLLSVTKVTKRLLNNGYSLIDHIPTNMHLGTRWLRFLRTDVINETLSEYQFPI